jgi:hypothetical protein
MFTEWMFAKHTGGGCSGTAYFKSKNFSAAFEDYTEAIRLNPSKVPLDRIILFKMLLPAQQLVLHIQGSYWCSLHHGFLAQSK